MHPDSQEIFSGKKIADKKYLRNSGQKDNTGNNAKNTSD